MDRFLNLQVTRDGRAQVLMDERFVFDTSNSSISAQQHFNLDFHCRWDNAGGINSGHIYMLAISTEVTNGPYLRWNSRIRYIDN